MDLCFKSPNLLIPNLPITMILIIGYGNSLRQDDGAGLILANTLAHACRTRNLPAKCITTHQLMPELALAIAAEEISVVVFVDTRVALPSEIEPAVQIRPLMADTSSPSLGHHLTPETLLLYARLLYGQQPAAWLVTVPGTAFNHGESLSELTKTALNTAPVNLLLSQLETVIQKTLTPA